MRLLARLFAALSLCAVSSIVPAAAEERDGAQTAYQPMAIFAEFAGKRWRGEGTGPDGKPIVDIADQKFILGGRAFQSTHRLESGVYGGTTVIFFDEGAQDYIFHYFTTAGFHTTGTITPTSNGFTAVETVNNHPTYAEVRSSASKEDGKLVVRSMHVTHDGETGGENEIVYEEVEVGAPLFEAHP